MSIIKEFREFFLRNLKVNSGSKSDQEKNYPTQYQVGTKVVYNRFLDENYPKGDIFSKLFNSLTFKLNPEDTATQTAQGLVRIATDAELLARTDNDSNTFTNVLQPHHLPTFVNQIASGDTVLDSFYTNGVRITLAKNTSGGKDYLKYLIESSNSVPIGACLLALNDFSGKEETANPPHGYLFTKGQIISRIAYPELYAVIGTTFGSGDGSTTFQLPTIKFPITTASGSKDFYAVIRYDDKHDVETGS
jgi:hypothetical protein